jgi:hypothetical protein
MHLLLITINLTTDLEKKILPNSCLMNRHIKTKRTPKEEEEEEEEEEVSIESRGQTTMIVYLCIGMVGEGE